MTAITVDDERPMLATLTAAVSASPDIASVQPFSSCTAALKWAEEHHLDYAFLDISMRGMGGMVLAEKLVDLHPECKIVFCTGYAQYAVDAFRLHVSGYLMKPITAEAVQKEIDHIKKEKNKEKLLRVQCFGHFEVFAKGVPLKFKRSKAKELLAILIDRNGAGMTGRQICAQMWADSQDDAKNMAHLRQLFTNLRQTLDQMGAGDILQQSGYSYMVDTARLECDYYSFLKTGKPEFRGEYMTQYSWAEETCGLLWRK